jgi:hypothetical protein
LKIRVSVVRFRPRPPISFDYRFGGKRNTLSLGTHPDTTLAIARRKAEQETLAKVHEADAPQAGRGRAARPAQADRLLQRWSFAANGITTAR